VLGGAKIFAGTMVAIDPANGFARPATATAGLRIAGVAARDVDNSEGGDGAAFVLVDLSHTSGWTSDYRFINDQTSPLTARDVLGDCYALDDQTVTANGAGKSVAGTVMRIAEGGLIVYVRFRN
jgi:hypothetical protein